MPRGKKMQMVTRDCFPIKIFEVNRKRPKYDIKKVAAQLRRKNSLQAILLEKQQTKSDNIINKIRIKSTKVSKPPAIRILDIAPVIIDSSSDEEDEPEDFDLSIRENIQVTALLSPELSHSFYVPVDVPVRPKTTSFVAKQQTQSYSCNKIPPEFSCFVRLERLPEAAVAAREIKPQRPETPPSTHDVPTPVGVNLTAISTNIESPFDLKIENRLSMPAIETPPPDHPLSPSVAASIPAPTAINVHPTPPMVLIPTTTPSTKGTTQTRRETPIKMKSMREIPNLKPIEKRERAPTPQPSPPLYEAITPPLRPLIKLRNINDLLEKRPVPTATCTMVPQQQQWPLGCIPSNVVSPSVPSLNAQQQQHQQQQQSNCPTPRTSPNTNGHTAAHPVQSIERMVQRHTVHYVPDCRQPQQNAAVNPVQPPMTTPVPASNQYSIQRQGLFYNQQQQLIPIQIQQQSPQILIQQPAVSILQSSQQFNSSPSQGHAPPPPSYQFHIQSQVIRLQPQVQQQSQQRQQHNQMNQQYPMYQNGYRVESAIRF